MRNCSSARLRGAGWGEGDSTVLFLREQQRDTAERPEAPAARRQADCGGARGEPWDAWHSPDPSTITPSLLTLSLSSRSVNNFLMTGPKVREIPLISVPDSTKPREGRRERERGAPPSHSSPLSLGQSSSHPQVSSKKAKRKARNL